MKLLFAVILFFSSFANAGLDNIRFQRLALDQGLSQETVTAIFQDSQGYMWFGTQEGLNRYDGYQFSVYSHDDRIKQSLSNDWIMSIAETSDHKLWIGTSNGGISIFDKNTSSFQHFKHHASNPKSVSSNRIQIVYVDSENTIWIGTENGLDKFNPETSNFDRINLDKIATETISVLTVIEDLNGHLWIGTDDNGIIRFDRNTGEYSGLTTETAGGYSLSSNKVLSLLFEDQNKLWVGYGGEGADRIDLASQSVERFLFDQNNPKSISNNIVRDIFSDQENNIWLATDYGLSRYEPGSKPSFARFIHEVENPYSLSGNKLTKIFQDRGGVFWVGSYSGLSKWNTATANFNHYRVTSDVSRSLTDNGVNAIHEDLQQNIWIATYAGLNRLNTLTQEITHFKHSSEDPDSISSDSLMALYIGESGKIWIGTRNHGLDVYDPTTNKFENFKPIEGDITSLSGVGVTSISAAQNGKIWVTTFGGGLNLLDPIKRTFTRFNHNPNKTTSIPSDRVIVANQLDNGLVWLGTWDQGLSIFNPDTESSIQIKHNAEDPNSLGSDVVISIYQDSQKNLWFGTSGGGLNLLSAENLAENNYVFDRITRREGLPSNVVYGVLEDQQGMLWISSNRGLTKYNPNSKALINYDSSHGLQGNEFNGGAFYRSNDNQFFFGGTNGVTAFYPQQITPNNHVPPVVLTNFLRLNESFSPIAAMQNRDAIQISYQDYLIAFEFAGLDFASPSNNKYSYKLKGFDDDWIEAGDLRRATYTNLPAGDYTFKVKASNNDGVWNEQGADLALTVLPAPWYSWWAYLGYALIVLLILTMIVRSYLNKAQKQALYRTKLEHEVKSRTSELREANELLLNASVTDQLTGLHNRRYLSNIIDHECAKVTREIHKLNEKVNDIGNTGPRLFCLMFDLDGFKPINDTYGHDAGDQIICQIGSLLKTVCRKSDTVIRWGGDEFLIVGRVEEMLEVNLLAERLRSEIVGKGFDIGLKQKLHLSCSIGYSLYPFVPRFPDSFSWEQIQIIADRALYYSKDAGRNHWAGIIATSKQPPVSLMNSLTNSLEQVIDQGYVKISETVAKQELVNQN
jgi:diguanylate cyclase (GGDEF)-like protein